MSKAGRPQNMLVKDVDELRENVIYHLENNGTLAPNAEKSGENEYVARYVKVDAQTGNVTVSQFGVKLSQIRGVVENPTLALEKKLPIESAFLKLTA